MAQRAYYGVQGPHPVATSYHDYAYRCWGPLLMRFVAESLVYWATFTPNVLAGMLRAAGWDSIAGEVSGVTQFGWFAAAFGMFVDFGIDFAVTKVPILRDFWPQMPLPLPAPAVVQAQVVEQTTKVTQLQTETTILPNPEPKP